ncbi:hypothetical protein WA026_005179 [Henosepilachna vigintioctopunctata]|uniref:Uncharacterized protein n=1 Tax=Henosepilachna vigintioctopunctata TaxID=420089 RepID=A0AAW1UNZ1_9CUCU
MYFRVQSSGGISFSEIIYNNQLGHYCDHSGELIRFVTHKVLCTWCFESKKQESTIVEHTIVSTHKIDTIVHKSNLHHYIKLFGQNCGLCEKSLLSVSEIEPRDCFEYRCNTL